MSTQHARPFSRRRFLCGLTLAGTAGFLGVPPRPAAAEPPPETTTLRLIKLSGICIAPQYVAEELLRAEGFADVQYVERDDTQQAGLLVKRGQLTRPSFGVSRTCRASRPGSVPMAEGPRCPQAQSLARGMYP
jgi:hypothetical protein